ncbi:Hypothetical predicted protein [Paramuricea clavata]|uniref:Uncharacterized protein n=1 Tax=Paramuricea clavata TaxID=317549 RepID=A0A6S7HSX5_PARCT|nr:Hypothetical predicted protein [Paramuricea clavata]
MKEAHELASKKIRDKGLKAKKSYDRWMRSTVLQPGDRVLVRNLSERGGPAPSRKRRGQRPEPTAMCESNESSSDEEIDDLVVLPTTTSDYPPQPPLCPPAIQPPTANDLVLQNEIPEEYVQLQEDFTIETPNAPPVHDPGHKMLSTRTYMMLRN